MRRRRIAGAAAAATALLFILLVWPVGLLTGDDDDDDGGDGGGTAQADEQSRVVGQLLLRPQSGEKGIGIAFITEADGERSLLVQGRELQRTREGQAYEVWLYNSQDDATSIGAQLTDRQGNFSGAGPLPEGYEDFEFLDISRETVDQNEEHSGDSVLRGRLNDVQPSAGTGSGELEGDSGAGEGDSPLPGG